MKGYWNDENTTAKTIIDGWLHTGDIGQLDEDNYLEITDRKKDILVNDKGENISPQRIEGLLALEDEIAQAMIYGDKRPHLVGLIVPDGEWMIDWAKKNGKSRNLHELQDDDDLRKAITEAVTRVNGRLSNTEKIRRIAIAKEAFSVENEQMTPTMKVRRHVVNETYRDTLEGMY
jgi:long-chain acyl-CoA synthetase